VCPMLYAPNCSLRPSQRNTIRRPSAEAKGIVVSDGNLSVQWLRSYEHSFTVKHFGIFLECSLGVSGLKNYFAGQ
jgi:hypothetical protein